MTHKMGHDDAVVKGEGRRSGASELTVY